MSDFELENFVKAKQQLEQKLSSIDRLKLKIVEMNNKVTHRGYQRVNSVMMRNVQIKHTSEFLIKLNNQYFAEVKSVTVLDNLDKKRKNYEQQLKNVSLKVQVAEKKGKKTEGQKVQPQFLGSFQKSKVEIVGTNEEGQSIFNIIQVQGEQDTEISQLPKNKQQQGNVNKLNLENTKSLAEPTAEKKAELIQEQKKAVVQQRISKEQEQQNQEEEGDDILLDYYAGNKQYSDEEDLSDIEQNEEEQDKKDLKLIQKSKSKKISKKQQQHSTTKIKTAEKESKQKTSSHDQHQSIKTPSDDKKVSFAETTKPSQTNKQTKQSPKQTHKKPAPEITQPKPISRFKLQRMKQKLQYDL